MSAVAAGAEIVEKHIALDKQKKGFDIQFSTKGKRLKIFKENITKTKMIMGKENFVRNNSENFNKRFRRSIFCIKNIKKGEIFTKKNIKKIRPGFGVLPSYYSNLLNKKSPENISAGNPIKKNILRKLKLKQN
jgi:sialic acid synthase SpsE